MLRGVLHFHPAKNASNKTKSLAVTVLRNMGDEDVYTKTTSLLAHSFSSRPKLPSLKYWLLGWSDHLQISENMCSLVNIAFTFHAGSDRIRSLWNEMLSGECVKGRKKIQYLHIYIKQYLFLGSRFR